MVERTNSNNKASILSQKIKIARETQISSIVDKWYEKVLEPTMIQELSIAAKFDWNMVDKWCEDNGKSDVTPDIFCNRLRELGFFVKLFTDAEPQILYVEIPPQGA